MKGPAFQTELATAYPECRLVVTKETLTVEGIIKASPHNCVCGLRPIFCPIRAVIKGGNTTVFRLSKNLAENVCDRAAGEV